MTLWVGLAGRSHASSDNIVGKTTYSSQSIGSTDKIATPMRFHTLVPGSVS